jgi:predicted Zn-dependent protease
MELIWVDLQGKVFQSAGIAVPGKEKMLHQSLSSFRQSTEAELNSIYVYRLQVVHAKPNETLKQISERYENRLATSFTELYNNVKPDEKLAGGSPIKVVTRTAYRRNR